MSAHGQPHPAFPASEMPKRIVRYRDMAFTHRGHLDTFIPGHERETAAIIGPGVMEDPSHRPAIPSTDGFNLTYARAKPGQGNALHDHETVEVFVPLNGRWSIRYGEDGAEEVILDPFDVISIPPGILRAFKNVSDQEACLLVIVGGDDPGHVLWPQQVIDRAAQHGAHLDVHGQVKLTAPS